MIISDYFLHLQLSNISILHRKNFIYPRAKSLFLDRDGVLIKDVNYINSPEQVSLCKNLEIFLKTARDLNFDVFVVTNQSSVARSIISIDQYLNITEKILSYLDPYIYPDFILASFHHPNKKASSMNWRKPENGMFSFILDNFSYSPSESITIGDKLSDFIPAYSVGIRKFLFIKTDFHIEEFNKVKKWKSSLKYPVEIKFSNELDKSFLKT